MTIIGIDPGLQGGIAYIGSEVKAFEMPCYSSIAFVNTVCAAEIYRHHICPLPNNSVAYVEHAQAMPKQGVVSVFNYGIGFGKILASLEIRGIEIKLVRPAIWKKALRLPKEKEAAVVMAEKLYPGISFRTPRGRLLDGKAEALLIAHYGMLKEMETKNDQQY